MQWISNILILHTYINRWSAAKDIFTAGCCTSGDCTTTPTTPAWSAPRTGGWRLPVLVTLRGLARWRRGCATDGHEMTDNSEAQPDTLGQLGKLLLKSKHILSLIVITALWCSVFLIIYLLIISILVRNFVKRSEGVCKKACIIFHMSLPWCAQTTTYCILSHF